MEPKDVLYQTISDYGEQRILSDIVQGESPITISTIYDHCMKDIDKFDTNPEEIRALFAESLIHYMLTAALIPSQRKTSFQSVEIDIVVPDTKTLASSPSHAVIISFQKTNELEELEDKVSMMKKIQPNSENIWIISYKPVLSDFKVYALDKDDFTFAHIINDLISFSSNKIKSKLKIFKI